MNPLKLQTVLSSKFWKENCFALVCLLCVFSMGFLWWLGQLPGFYNFDTFVLIKDVGIGKLAGWHSLLYSLYSLPFHILSPDLSLMGLFHITAIAVLIAALSKKIAINKKSKVLFAIVTLLYLISPYNMVMPIYYNRDILFSWALVCLLVYNYFVLLDLLTGKELKVSQIITLSILTTFVAGLRLESMMYCVLIPASLLVVSKTEFLRKAKLIVPLFLASLLIVLIPLKQINFLTKDLRYQLTAYLNPVSYILVRRPNSLSPEQINKLERVVLLQDIIDHPSNFEIDVFHTGNILPFGREDFKAFKEVRGEIIWDNLDLFLENRVKMTHALLGRTGWSRYFSDDLRLGRYPLALEVIRKYKIKKKSPIDGLGDWQWDFLKKSMSNRLAKAFSWSSHWSLAVCLWVLIWFRRFPITAITSGLLLIRVFAIFVTAPASLTKYIYSLYLFGFVVVSLLLFERLKSQSETGLSRKHS